MAKQRFELNSAELTLNRLGREDYKASMKLKKYHVKITMIKPYEVLDFWFKKPDVYSMLEVMMGELSKVNLTEYFKFEVHEI